MIGLRFAVTAALVPLMGGWVAAFASVRALPRAARVAGYTAAGIVTIALEMFVLAVVGVPWYPALLLVAIPPSLWALTKPGNPATQQPGNEETEQLSNRGPLLIALAALAVVTAVVLAGAATSFDLLLFWGVKGQHFGLARTIDVAFLRDPAHHLMHSDYPPLVPLLYAWTMTGGTYLDWFGTIATAPLLLLAGTTAVWGFTRSASMTALYATTFGFLFLDNNIAGNAEPMLLFLETVAAAVLVCTPECEVLAIVALTGVMLTKVEGAVFVAAAMLLAPRRAGRLLPAPLVALGAWIAFCAHHGLLDTYRSHVGASHSAFAAVVKPLLVEASMHAYYVPWIALVLLVARGRRRTSLPALGAAALYLAFLVVVWAGGAEAGIAQEIAWSARRVLVTPMLFLFFAAVRAASASGQAAAESG